MSQLTLAQLDPERLPKHVAIIMDGNGRWAQQRKKPRLHGHYRGADVLSDVAQAASNLGIAYLTVYAFSEENWSRPAIEIKGLMQLLKIYLARKLKDFKRNQIRLRTIGNIDKLPKQVQKLLHSTMEQTASHTGLVLTLALSYGGRDEIVRAVRRIVDTGIPAEKIGADLFEKYLDTSSYPDPDLLIRTSGEMRISNFLLWQIAYTELVITPVPWPEFTVDTFYQALAQYQLRDRRFGGVVVSHHV